VHKDNGVRLLQFGHELCSIAKKVTSKIISDEYRHSIIQIAVPAIVSLLL